MEREGASAATALARKRKRDAPVTSLAPKDKRRKFQDAREIAVQTSESAFRDGQFDVTSFICSREHEIKNLLRSMNSSRHFQRKRAFQGLPRELRRRTAAHNASRVPKRIRPLARMELLEDNTPPKKNRRDYRPNAHRLNSAQLRMLSKQSDGSDAAPLETQESQTKHWTKGKSQQSSKSYRYRKRQRHKTWLPTHIWCAKRAHMVCRWGFMLAETPTLKCHRPTYRAASREGCVAFDTSHYATMLLEGKEKDIKRCLTKVLQPQDLAIFGKHTVSGEAAASTWVYAERGWPDGAVAPVQLLWCPWQKEGSVSNTEVKSRRWRKVALRIHPSAWEDVWKCVSSCAPVSKCAVRNLRFEIGSIRLVGPKAIDTLKTLLQKDQQEFSDKLEAALLNATLYDSSIDPRLNSLYLNKHGCASLLPRQRDGSPAKEQRTIFDAGYRNESVRKQVSQKTLSARVSKMATGGIIASAASCVVPFALVKEALGEKAVVTGSGEGEFNFPECWSIILPWKWVRIFWLALMRITGVRFGGLKELEQLTLEGRLGCYPVDFPATRAGMAEAARRCQESLDQAKRRSTTKVKIPAKEQPKQGSDGFEAEPGFPWGAVFRSTAGSYATKSHLAPQDKPEIWHLPPSLARLLSTTPRTSLPPSITCAVFTVHIKLFGRGTVVPDARVFRLPQPGTRIFQQLKLQHAGTGRPTAGILGGLEDGEEMQEQAGAQSGTMAAGEAPGDPGSPIGFVVRGNFGYSEGIPVAVAVLSWFRALESRRRDGDGCSGWCVLRNTDGGMMRLAQWTAL